MPSDATRITGFAPLLGKRPQVLILGSMPSVTSLEKQQYYGQSQNAFWKIMGALCGIDPELSYAQRTRVLTGQGVAVWDVLASCVRPGSLDSAIDLATAEVNDIPLLLLQHPAIRHIFFNGKKSAEVFRRRLLADITTLRPALSYTTLPSTSPALATLNFDAKLARWQVVADALSC